MSGAIDCLRQCTVDGLVDFIVAAHSPGALLVRIRAGAVLDIPCVCTIGDPDGFRDVVDIAHQHQAGASLRHSDTRLKFIDRLTTVPAGGETVGGLPVALVAGPDAHSYPPSSASFIFNLHMEWGKVIHQPKAGLLSGQDEYRFSLVPASVTDVPVLGVYLPQARTGYVYSPLEQPRAFGYSLARREFDWIGQEAGLIQEIQRRVDEHAGKFV